MFVCVSLSSDDKPTSSKKRKSGGQDTEMPVPLPKKKRVSFGGQLSPELFDKRLPPDSPLRRGATPSRRSLGSGLGQTPKSLLRRASTIGLVQVRAHSPERWPPCCQGSKRKKNK